MKKIKIFGLVILFNPQKCIMRNIHSYLNELSHLYIIDNSPQINDFFFSRQNDKITYIPNCKNYGIAKALNIGVHKCIEDGAEWALLMDQDSYFKDGSLDILIDEITLNEKNKIGSISPFHHSKKNDFRYNDLLTKETSLTMTSGTLLNLKAFSEIGDFDEKLFIDHVDHEYCLRLKRNGYKVLECGKSILIHELGEIRSYNIFNRKFYFIYHSPLRLYYYTRNGLYVSFKYIKDYPFFIIKFSKDMFKEIIKTFLFRHEFLERIKMMFFGVKDFIFSNYGKKL
ncbi:MAG: glycosyltransferase family 2 protein [Paludibacter sp.]|nr:glycosyltransferase family 2 protein [Paludibacter sp.]